MRIIPFNQVHLFTRDEVGNKAYNLSVIAQLGFNVPEGFCISSSVFTEFLSENGLLDLCMNINSEHTLHLIQNRIENASFSEVVQREITEALYSIDLSGQALLACRSSGIDEDLDGASFAGMYVSTLNVRGIDQLLRCIKLCYQSVFSDNVFRYKERMGLTKSLSQMCVIVQLQISPRCAGVAFSCNPADGNAEVMIIEALHGLGEAVVAGGSDVDQYIVERKTQKLLLAKRGEQENATRSNTNNSDDLCLSVTDISILNESITALENHFGSHVDVEFAFVNSGTESKLYLFQCRPLSIHGKCVKESTGVGKEACIQGVGVSKGVYAGKTRHVKTDGSTKLMKNEVLVTKGLSIDLYDAMYMSGAVVVENDSLINHACTVTRELGIPCVIGVRDIFNQIENAIDVVVDGNNGVVHLSKGNLQQNKSGSSQTVIDADHRFVVANEESLYLFHAKKHDYIFDSSVFFAKLLSFREGNYITDMYATIDKVLKYKNFITDIMIWMPEVKEASNILHMDTDGSILQDILHVQLDMYANSQFSKIIIPYKSNYHQLIKDACQNYSKENVWIDMSFDHSREDIDLKCKGVILNVQQYLNTEKETRGLLEIPIMVKCDSLEDLKKLESHGYPEAKNIIIPSSLINLKDRHIFDYGVLPQTNESSIIYEQWNDI